MRVPSLKQFLPSLSCEFCIRCSGLGACLLAVWCPHCASAGNERPSPMHDHRIVRLQAQTPMPLRMLTPLSMPSVLSPGVEPPLLAAMPASGLCGTEVAGALRPGWLQAHWSPSYKF